jgi:hypothetical protein
MGFGNEDRPVEAVAFGPLRPNAEGGGVVVSPATSYCPILRLPEGVMANEVKM